MNRVTLYFRPHLCDENEDWLSILHKGTPFHLREHESFTPRDADLLFIRTGCVRYFCNTAGYKNTLTLIVGRHSLVNIGGAVTGANRFSRVVATEPTEIVLFSGYAFWDVRTVQEHPSLYRSMAKTLAKTIELYSSRAHNTCFHACVPRICHSLLTLCSPTYHEGEQYITALTQNDMALFCGMHYVTLSNALRLLREKDVIGEVTAHGIESVDYEKLVQISQLQLQL